MFRFSSGSATMRAPGAGRTAAAVLLPIVLAALFFALGSPVRAAPSQRPVSIALLGAFLHNDNEGLDPTSDAERARMDKIASTFRMLLEASGRYSFVAVNDAVRQKVANGQPLGRCGGCELSFGKELVVDAVAWIEVQTVSNLILNMNVYIAGTADPALNFVHSVDIRGNTDESWTRSLNYLVNNYLLAPTLIAPRT